MQAKFWKKSTNDMPAFNSGASSISIYSLFLFVFIFTWWWCGFARTDGG
jgi:hypothetical protein